MAARADQSRRTWDLERPFDFASLYRFGHPSSRFPPLRHEAMTNSLFLCSLRKGLSQPTQRTRRLLRVGAPAHRDPQQVGGERSGRAGHRVRRVPRQVQDEVHVPAVELLRQSEFGADQPRPLDECHPLLLRSSRRTPRAPPVARYRAPAAGSVEPAGRDGGVPPPPPGVHPVRAPGSPAPPSVEGVGRRPSPSRRSRCPPLPRPVPSRSGWPSSPNRSSPRSTASPTRSAGLPNTSPPPDTRPWSSPPAAAPPTTRASPCSACPPCRC